MSLFQILVLKSTKIITSLRNNNNHNDDEWWYKSTFLSFTLLLSLVIFFCQTIKQTLWLIFILKRKLQNYIQYRCNYRYRYRYRDRDRSRDNNKHQYSPIVFIEKRMHETPHKDNTEIWKKKKDHSRLLETKTYVTVRNSNAGLPVLFFFFRNNNHFFFV